MMDLDGPPLSLTQVSDVTGNLGFSPVATP